MSCLLGGFIFMGKDRGGVGDDRPSERGPY